jgi:diguanylate cyclase (GGDEF)-like protein
MNHPRAISDKAKLIIALCLLLSIGFLATTLVSYYVSREAIRDSIQSTELPLTSDNVYSEIQKDLIRPILISSMMARDTFLRDWVVSGERDTDQMTRYLNEIMSHYGAVTSFFVSDSSRIYYSTKGVLKTVRPDEARDVWYYRLRAMKEAYEINVDPDLANRDTLTIFINYRVFDYQQRFIGATGVGLTVDTVNRLIDDYQQRYGRTIYLVDSHGKITLSGKHGSAGRDNTGPPVSSIHDIDGLDSQATAILKAGNGAFEYQSQDGHRHFLNVRYIPELKWHLFVIKQEDQALGTIQHTLYLNLLLCLAITLIVLLIVHLTINHYQRRLETLATTDHLTGLANRHALDLLLDQQTREATRQGTPMSAIMLDIDHFKTLNDGRGHLAGDEVLRGIAATLKGGLRASDIACRWGGEEFLVVLPHTDLAAASQVARDLRERIEKTRYEFEGSPLLITISAGVATYRREESRESFIARTDALLYQAKREGRNRVCGEQITQDIFRPE